MPGPCRSGEVIGNRLNDRSVVQPNLGLEYLGSHGEGRIALNEATDRLEGHGLGLVQIIRHNENLVRRLLGIGPPDGDTRANSGFTALLRLRVNVSRVSELTFSVEGEGAVKNLPLVRDQSERLPGLVPANEPVEELDGP